MKIDRIGFGYVKNLGGYENCKLYIEAALEPWEDPSQSLDLLRTKVAEELDLPDGWRDLRCKYNQEVAALRNAENAREKAEKKLKEAQEAWESLQLFFSSNGIDPETLGITAAASFSLLHKTSKITTQEPSTQNDLLPLNTEAVEDDDDYFDPYYGDEYDRLHDDQADKQPEDSYF